MSFKKLGEINIDETPVSNSNNLITSNAVAQLSNPNLLINGDFRINQRGKDSYTATSTDKVYTVDRWFISYAGTQLTKLSNGVNISISRQYGRIEQDIEDFDKFKGKTITLSAKINNTSLTRTTRPQLQLYDGINQKTVYIDGAGTYSMNFDVSNNATILCVRLLTFSTDTNIDSIDIEYIKLEIGNVATPFSPRPYAEELALCQRYYQVIDGPSNRLGPAVIYQANLVHFTIPLVCNLRAIPTITIGNGIVVENYNGTAQTGFTFSASLVAYNFIKIQANKTNHGLSGIISLMQRSSDFTDASIQIDAEIY